MLLEIMLLEIGADERFTCRLSVASASSRRVVRSDGPMGKNAAIVKFGFVVASAPSPVLGARGLKTARFFPHEAAPSELVRRSDSQGNFAGGLT
jgi:hypothetical protein